ncbi:ABC transporter substrate-binding protein [Anaerocolumna sp. AGMB13020]|uniref:ABC transporter substrate-binding protein n=1 Tax=Anaerocolumna sp. AGMB13020 TaxID=3081750 RepID=UPI002954D1F7|nr:ABC transporter substrate-binding protein [Anaerocolumna sp. AGMB13020]WOO37737.1 ABC transporter substrate-binding protein [Anaerocolumna sp. AGMB13020]
MLKRMRVFVVICLMFSIILTGCKGSSNTPDNNSGTKETNAEQSEPTGTKEPEKEAEPVTLKWVFLSPGEQKDAQEVWNKFNEELQKYLPGTTVKFEGITSADYAEKWKLISASQENVDIVWHGWMVPYVTEVRKGSYMELDKLMEEYAPSLLKEIPENILDKSRVDGKLYSIPNMQQMVSYVSTLQFPIKIYEKYKDQINVEQLAELFGSHQKMDQELWDELEKYIVMIKDGGDLQKGVFGFADHVEKGYEWILNPYKIDIYSDDYTPVNLYRTPEYETFVKEYSDWYQKGYIRKDILTADNVSQEIYEVRGGGNYLVGQGYYPTESEIATSEAAGSTAYVKIPFDNSHYIPYAAAATNMAISSNSKNPERAMQLIELMNTEKGKDLYNLMVYGIEGKHYNKINDKEIQPIGYTSQPTADSPYGQYNWAIGNIFNGYEIYMENKPLTLQSDFIRQVNADAAPSKLKGFTLDTDPIKTELAQVNAVIGEYKTTLNSGAAPDADALYKDFVTKLIKAGDDVVTKEIQRQIDEWRASK